MTDPRGAAQQDNRADVVIIGGGLSGALLAMQLLRQPGARHIAIFEPRAELGRGEAYSAVELGHTLNANAARMSVDPDIADDLVHWLAEHIAAGGWPESAEQGVPVAELFPPRELFGCYARQRLAQALAAAPRSRLTHIPAQATDLHIEGAQACVTAQSGERWWAPVAVLATGVFAAARTRRSEGGGGVTSGLDPWDINAMKGLPPDATVAIVGAGLTMIDALVSLRQAGHRGPVRVFSRHGLLPHPRRQPPAWADFLAAQPQVRTPRQLSMALREQCRLAAAQGVDWQAPLDTVRPHVARLWSQASDFQRRQFVRHLRPWWETHHHRSPPQGAALLADWQRTGRLSIEAACVQGVAATGQGVALTIRRRGQASPCTVHATALINSSGIEYDWRRVDKPLPRQLLQRGLVRPGPLALGIDASADGAVRDESGMPSTVLFAMGPPLRGLWWESTSVNDVAAQAKALAAHLFTR